MRPHLPEEDGSGPASLDRRDHRPARSNPDGSFAASYSVRSESAPGCRPALGRPERPSDSRAPQQTSGCEQEDSGETVSRRRGPDCRQVAAATSSHASDAPIGGRSEGHTRRAGIRLQYAECVYFYVQENIGNNANGVFQRRGQTSHPCIEPLSQKQSVGFGKTRPRFFLDPSAKSMEYWVATGVRGNPTAKRIFGTIYLQWIGRWGLFSRRGSSWLESITYVLSTP